LWLDFIESCQNQCLASLMTPVGYKDDVDH